MGSIIADVVGWYDNASGTAGARYTPLVPRRVFDTRYGTGAPAAKVGAGAGVDLQVNGRGGCPPPGSPGWS